jgi:ribonucleoside-triphosphate reductase
VFHTKDVFKALEHQDPIQTKYTGGTVFHIFLGERLNSIETTKNLVRRISERFHLPYYSLTPTFSVCPVHGYLSGEHMECPVCKGDMENGIKQQIAELKEKLTV